MSTAKLDAAAAKVCGAQVADTLLRIQAGRSWSDGDLIAVATVALSNVLELKIGRAKAVDLLRDMADEIEAPLLRGGR